MKEQQATYGQNKMTHIENGSLSEQARALLLYYEWSIAAPQGVNMGPVTQLQDLRTLKT